MAETNNRRATGAEGKDAVVIPKRVEQVITVLSGVVGIFGPIVTFFSGASTQTFLVIALVSFVLLAVTGIFFTGRNILLARIINVLAVVVVTGSAAIYFLLGDFATAEEVPRPPRLEVKAWVDLSDIEKLPDGSVMKIQGDGKKGAFEQYIMPVEVYTPNASASTLLRRIPGYFADFEPGETVTASVCGLEFELATYPKTDERYTDQMSFLIPVPESSAKNCDK
ncbi:MAG: hypothetical protein WA940_17590 [Sphingopyxis sp.]|jgi:hypothetical protein